MNIKKINVFKKFCGVYFAVNQWGNCFSPALCVNAENWDSKPYTTAGKTKQPARLILTLRWNWRETKVYWAGGLKCWWNSEHLAVRFGKVQETAFGEVYILNVKILGIHCHHIYI
jgi:hypothetical protein